jgi:hypothetical protein
MSRVIRAAAAVALAASVLAGATAAGPEFPARIDFPAGWAAEGIFGKGHTFWAGNTATGSIYRGDILTGEGSVLVDVTGKSALGVFVDNRNRLWVAGGSGTARHAYVYDAETGELIQDITLSPTAAGFGTINDVTVTQDAAFFTNTNNAMNPQANVLFKVPLGKHGEIGTPTAVPIPFYGANGIEATKNGKTLIVVSIGQSKYYKIDADTSGCPVVVPGECEEIVLDQPAPRGDGLILHGHTLYSVLNLPNAAFPGLCGDVAVIKLHDDMTAGEVVDHLNSADDPLINPATADLFGKYLYVVRRNATPGTCSTTGVTPTVRWLTRLDKHGDDEDDE